MSRSATAGLTFPPALELHPNGLVDVLGEVQYALLLLLLLILRQSTGDPVKARHPRRHSVGTSRSCGIPRRRDGAEVHGRYNATATAGDHRRRPPPQTATDRHRPQRPPPPREPPELPRSSPPSSPRRRHHHRRRHSPFHSAPPEVTSRPGGARWRLGAVGRDVRGGLWVPCAEGSGPAQVGTKRRRRRGRPGMAAWPAQLRLWLLLHLLPQVSGCAGLCPPRATRGHPG